MSREKSKESLRAAVMRLDSRLGHQLERVWQMAEDGIQEAQKSKDGHQQGPAHCRAVEENLAALIADEWKGTRFSTLDLFVLSAAAALHDAGKAMQIDEDHGRAAMWEIREHPERFGLDAGQAVAVGWIVGAHNDGDLEALPAEPVPLGVAEVRVRPLAALFKLSDALHTHYQRVSPQATESFGRHAEDSSKTLFRSRILGWVFDFQGRIALSAQAIDWNDIDVIHKGFEMTRDELETVAPALKDAGLPWDLTLHVDTSPLERKATVEIRAREHVERAFVGMDYFSEADADHFKGRDDVTESLLHQVMAKSITLLVGDSGMGKTSLIHAGLFPRLRKMQWNPIYIRAFDDPDHFIVNGLYNEFLGQEPPAGMKIVEALEAVCKEKKNCRLVVALDQFEDVLRVPAAELEAGVGRALTAVQAGCFRNLHLLVSYRADAEAGLGPLFQAVAGSPRGLSKVYLQPLSREGARVALEAGFAEAQVGLCDPLLLDAIADDLERQTTTGVYPPYVQMVGETLSRLASEKGDGILTEESYREAGGCGRIIGQYLIDRLEEFGERKETARRLLVALVRSTGVKGQATAEELQAAIDVEPETVTTLLAALVDKRMIRHLGGGAYEIVHDYLALLVDRELVGEEERQIKHWREFLALKARAYITSSVPLQSSEMAQLYALRRCFTPDTDELRLLLHSSLMGHGPVWFLMRGVHESAVSSVLRDALTRPAARLRLVAMRVLVALDGTDAIPDLRRLLRDPDEGVQVAATVALARLHIATGRDVVVNLRELTRSPNPNVRRAAVDGLLAVGDRDAIAELRSLISDRNWAVSWAASQALPAVLAAMGSDAISSLRELRKHRNRDLRWVATLTLAKVAGRGAISDLRELIKDPFWRVRQAAALALVPLITVAGPEAIPELEDLTRNPDSKVRQVAIEGLAQAAGQHAIPDLRELCTDADRQVRQAAAVALTQVLAKMGRAGISDLRELVKSRAPAIRAAAETALTRILDELGQKNTVELYELAGDRNPGVRQAALTALGRMAGRKAIPALRRALRDPSWRPRQAAATALVEVLTPLGQEAIPHLRALLTGSSPNSQETAAKALVQVLSTLGRDALPDLRDLMKDPDWRVRQVAAEALEQVGGQEEISALRELIRDSDAPVRRSAAKALKNLANEGDLDWLAGDVIHYPLSDIGQVLNEVLIVLDRRAYCPREWRAALEERAKSLWESPDLLPSE